MTKRIILGPVFPYVAASALSIGLIAQPAFGQLPWMNTSLTPEARTELLLDAMTLDEKIQQIANLPHPNNELPGCGFTASDARSRAFPGSRFRRSGRSTVATA